MNNKYDMNDEIYELEDQLPTFDADVDVLELLSDATFFGLDDEEKDIPGYIFADVLAGMLGMPTEELVDFARDNGYDIFIANSNDKENSDAMFIICAKGCDLEMIKNDYKEIYDGGIEISPVKEVEESSVEESINTKLNKYWLNKDGTPVKDYVCMTNDGPKDYYDKYWIRYGFHFTVWLRDGRPEGIISDAKLQNWAFDDYPDDVKYDGIKFKHTDDGAIFFKADYSMSPEDVLNALKTIANESEYLQKHVSKDEEDDELNEENELQKTARRHKKTDKKGARGWFVNTASGDVEHNVAFFNKALGNSTATADGAVGSVSAGGGMGESVSKNYTEQELIDAVMDAYGLSKKGTLQLIKRMSDNKKELIVKGFKQDANKNFYEKKEKETKEQFVSRFMEDKKTEYKNPKRRFEVALEYWRKQK